jgi:hypothetical protein
MSKLDAVGAWKSMNREMYNKAERLNQIDSLVAIWKRLVFWCEKKTHLCEHIFCRFFDGIVRPFATSHMDSFSARLRIIPAPK